MAIVVRIIGNDCRPVEAMTDRFMPKPSNITAYWRIFFEVKEIPGFSLHLSLIRSVRTMPSKIEKTGPPTTGTSPPSSQAGTAIERHNAMPGPFVFRQFK